MTKFTSEQHKTLMLNCAEILVCMIEVRSIIKHDDSLDEELKGIAKCLMDFSHKMVGK